MTKYVVEIDVTDPDALVASPDVCFEILPGCGGGDYVARLISESRECLETWLRENYDDDGFYADLIIEE